MRSLIATDMLEIHVTNACVLRCAGCTHLCGHHKHPYMMTMEQFVKVVDSLAGFPKIIGLMGGEPLLVPWFADMARYARSKFPREQLILLSVFPEGEKYSRHREVICECFGQLLLNDHSIENIMHAPILMAAGEFFDDDRDAYACADQCWIQNHWSPGVTPKGAFFCEVAGELDQLFDGPGGWDISEPGWWKRSPKDYTEQIERSCLKCGGSIPFKRKSSKDEVCDISEGNARLLRGKSRKVDNGLVQIHAKEELKSLIDMSVMDNGTGYPNQVYKDEAYRRKIAARYGIGLKLNAQGFMDPYLLRQHGEGARSTLPVEQAVA